MTIHKITKNLLEFKIAQRFWIQTFLEFFYSCVFWKTVLLFSHSKSTKVSTISLSYTCPAEYPNSDKINTTPLQWYFALSTWSLPSTITLLVSEMQKQVGCWQQGFKWQEFYVRCQPPHVGTQELKIKQKQQILLSSPSLVPWYKKKKIMGFKLKTKQNKLYPS